MLLQTVQGSAAESDGKDVAFRVFKTLAGKHHSRQFGAAIAAVDKMLAELRQAEEAR
jgi:hypothetical protein